MKIQKPYLEFYNWCHATPDKEVWRVDWAKFDLPYCGVYVITPDNDWPCKIGISKRPVKRLQALQTSHWVPLKVAQYRWCMDGNSARAVEAAVHRELDDRQLLGEWFDIRAKEAVEVMESVAMCECASLHAGVPKDRDDITKHLKKLINHWQLRSGSIDHQSRIDDGAPIYDARTGREIKV